MRHTDRRVFRSRRSLTSAIALAIIVLSCTSCASNGATSGEAQPASPTRATSALAAVATSSPSLLPSTWPDGLDAPSAGTLRSIACLDGNHDGHVDSSDGPDFAGVDVLVRDGACEPFAHADYFVSAPSDPGSYTCGAGPAPLVVVSIASSGSDLLAPKEGESLGMLRIINGIRSAARIDGIDTMTILTTPAIRGAVDYPQTSMERWIEHDLGQRLDALPCLRAALIGHSHGGVTVTSVIAALEDRYPGRLFGALLDRTTIVYDRPAAEMPLASPILNVYQTNEGWHGSRIDQPNVANYDESHETAPIARSDGGGGAATVSHKTLDDALAAQELVITGVMDWATSGR